ncbi:MAG: sterol desaturase family protein [Bacteriovoracaceae bacterium]|nr:sterol desaturase family protein [Bacteriovoracaceae bacterium]
MGSLITYLFYPIILVASVSFAIFLNSKGFALTHIILLNALVFPGIILLFEFIHPETKDWRPRKSEVGVDILHAALSNTLPPLLFKALFFAAIIKLNSLITTNLGIDIWPHQLPIGLQVLLALVVAEIGFYWPHRILHENTPIWPLHALHHSVEHMYLLAGGRTHPLQVFVTYGLQMLILWLLGAPEKILMLHAVFTSTHGILQHANVKMRFGFLNYIFATPELHRWHHSRVIKESNSNYGSNVCTWDLVFGSHHYFADKLPSEDIGLPPSIVIPDNYIEHMKSPFVFNKYDSDL